MDGHEGEVPDPVWELLEYTPSGAPTTTGALFEVLKEFVKRPGPDGIVREPERTRTNWRISHQNREVAACLGH